MRDIGLAMRQRKHNLAARLAILLAVLIVFGGLANYYLQAQHEKVLAEKREKLERVVSSLQSRLNGSLLAVRLLAADPDLASLEPARIEPKLERAVATLDLQKAALFDVAGNTITGTEGTLPHKTRDEASFKLALGGNAVISNRIIPGLLEDAFMSLMAPIYDSQRQVAGVLAVAIPIIDLSSIVEKENTPDGQYIFIIDGNGQFVHHPRLKEIHPEDTEYFKHVFPLNNRTAILAKRSVIDDVDKIYIYQSLERTQWRVVYAIPVQNVYTEVLVKTAPDILVLLLLMMSITLLYRYLREENRHRQLLENMRLERLSAATEMAAGIAHEVRNPLTSIKGFIQLMLHKEDKSNFNNYLEIILGEIERIDTLIGEFQMLARPLRQPQMRKVDLGKIVGDVIMLMEGQAGNKNITLEYQAQGELFEDSGLWTNADMPQVKQVLINLIRNAFDSVNIGGRVEVTVNRAGDMIAIRIQDNGIGMSPEIIKKLGTPFFTTKEGGTGLGLSVCYTIIHNHGGRLEVSSEIGEGTTFTVLLPQLEA